MHLQCIWKARFQLENCKLCIETTQTRVALFTVPYSFNSSESLSLSLHYFGRFIFVDNEPLAAARCCSDDDDSNDDSNQPEQDQ